jgi:DAACS family dicarboxylate/amino acid:cation (Na+ or H+) symporter
MAEPRRRVPLAAWILVGAAAGALLGAWLGTAELLPGLDSQDLGELGLLFVRLLKALAVPLIFVAILDSLLRSEIRARQGARLVAICLVNAAVALTIGLTLLNVLRPGDAWRGRFQERAGLGGGGAPAPAASLSPLRNLDGLVPASLLDPFAKNSVISVVLLALLAGAAMRRVRSAGPASAQAGLATLTRAVEAGYATLVAMLGFVVHAIPFAVFGVVAAVVARSGLGAFAALGSFLAVILAGLLLHGFVYYPLAAWLVGGKPPRVYLGRGAEAVLTGLSTNSSLASVPLTLRALERMGVSPESARLSACVGTNLNNDGIALYDAMAALFLAQACGFELDLGQQLVVALASLAAGAGITGIPEAGLIVLPLVLGAAGLPEQVVAAAIPLVLPVDWIIGRVRSAVNVMSDLLVAILLDAFGGAATPSPSSSPAG